MKAYLESQDLWDLSHRGSTPQNEEGMFKAQRDLKQATKRRIKMLLVRFIEILMIRFFKMSQIVPLQSKHVGFFKIYMKVQTKSKKFHLQLLEENMKFYP